MKLSFSTNGWNGRSFPDFVSLAKSLGFSGLELHDVLHTGWTQEGGPFHPENAGRTSHLLFREGVRLTCLDSVCDLSDAARAAENEREIAACIRLAHDFSVPFVRVRAQDGSDAGLAAAAALVERALPAHALSLLRGLVLLVPAAFAFAALWGLVGVWLAVPVTEAVTAAAGYLVLRRERARGFGGELQP